MALLSGKVEPDVDNHFSVFSFCFASFRHPYQPTLNCIGINAVQYLLQMPSSSEPPVKSMSCKSVTTRISRKLSCHMMESEICGPCVLYCPGSFSDVWREFIADLSTIL